MADEEGEWLCSLINWIFPRLMVLPNSEPVKGSILHHGTTWKLRKSFPLLLLGLLAASHSPGEMQSRINFLLWTRHRRRYWWEFSSIFSVSPNPGLKALTRAAPAPDTKRVLASENLMGVLTGTLFLGCQGIRASVQATWGNFKHALGYSGFWELKSC